MRLIASFFLVTALLLASPSLAPAAGPYSRDEAGFFQAGNDNRSQQNHQRH